ncbi:hypothetical protein [Aquibacillus albus]|uniref:Uncharacterized protein n=1 Tax=Aquibacillus albus TaxID=1168171 RepID=A0ABS2MW24_9BACI|nr:hypothetical protein [Aquibacillus albus]MBM7570097.1 hypothetical protein [Aquibacillus albus]
MPHDTKETPCHSGKSHPTVDGFQLEKGELVAGWLFSKTSLKLEA